MGMILRIDVLEAYAVLHFSHWICLSNRLLFSITILHIMNKKITNIDQQSFAVY